MLARYGLGELAGHALATTLAINCAGSFALGALVGAGAAGRTRAALGTGFCGGFTTYSTFAVQVVTEVDDGRSGTALALVAGTVVLGVAAAAAGFLVARAAA